MTVRPDAASNTSSTAPNSERSRNDASVGGISIISPRSLPSIAACGRIQATWSASPPTSRVRCPAGSAVTKNLVSNRRDSTSGVSQWVQARQQVGANDQVAAKHQLRERQRAIDQRQPVGFPVVTARVGDDRRTVRAGKQDAGLFEPNLGDLDGVVRAEPARDVDIRRRHVEVEAPAASRTRPTATSLRGCSPTRRSQPRPCRAGGGSFRWTGGRGPDTRRGPAPTGMVCSLPGLIATSNFLLYFA